MEPLVVQLDNQGLICNDTGWKLKDAIRRNMPEDCQKTPMSLARDLLKKASNELKSTHVMEYTLRDGTTILFYRTLPTYHTIEKVVEAWKRNQHSKEPANGQ